MATRPGAAMSAVIRPGTRAVAGAALAAVLASTAAANVVDPWVRVADDGTALQTRLLVLQHPAGVRLTLVAVTHVAAPDYFQSIARRAQGATVVCEGIERTNTPPMGPTRDTPLPTGLVHQSAWLRLDPERVFLGDLDEQTFEQQRQPAALAAPPTTRLALAGAILSAVLDPTLRQLNSDAFAIPQRNAAAIETVRHRLACGDRELVMIYGLAHADDLQQRLQRELGFRPVSSEWLTAFSW